ncbi:MAG TPA: hypothetical protein VN282_21085 [Pyrinomonadaceae bacterium]|nr:hypothetical protein [Pyrinomonadaceae bacterium]
MEIVEMDGEPFRLWDGVFGGALATFLSAPDPRICVDNNGTMGCTWNCPDVYFCSFIGVPVPGDTFSIEVRDYDDSTFVTNSDDVIGKGSCGVNQVCRLGAAKVTVTQIPCDDDQIQVNFYEGAKKGRFMFGSGFEAFYPGQKYHLYSMLGRICKVGTKGCDVRTVFSMMTSQVRYVAPSDSTLPVNNCGVNELKSYVSPNRVRTFVDSENSTIVNFTLKGHLFYPGKVTRKVVSKDGWVVVITEGEGYGQMAGINEAVGGSIFEGIDKDLAEAVGKKLATPAGRAKKKR